MVDLLRNLDEYEIIDISMEIHNDMPIYKDRTEKRPCIRNITDYFTSDMFESEIKMNLHTGTHIDAPLHFLDDGKSIDKMNIKKFISKCKVLDFSQIDDVITRADLEKRDINSGDLILIKTKNSAANNSITTNFVYIDSSGADYLNEKKIRGVGIDSLGIERNQENHPTHKVLLRNDIYIIEGLFLKDVKEGEYIFIGLPLKIRKAEASPIRAILLTKDKALD